MVSGALTYCALGLTTALLGATFVFRPIAVVWFVGTVLWYLAGSRRVPFGRASVQARRDLAQKGSPGLVYFGAVLGIGLLTQMAAPLVYGGALPTLSSSPSWGLAYGAASGVGRSAPAWAGAILAGRWDPTSVSLGLIEKGYGLRRLTGAGAAPFY